MSGLLIGLLGLIAVMFLLVIPAYQAFERKTFQLYKIFGYLPQDAVQQQEILFKFLYQGEFRGTAPSIRPFFSLCECAGVAVSVVVIFAHSSIFICSFCSSTLCSPCLVPSALCYHAVLAFLNGLVLCMQHNYVSCSSLLLHARFVHCMERESLAWTCSGP